MTLLLLWRILFHLFIVEVAPAFLRGWTEHQVFKLFGTASKKRRLMPRGKAKMGKPFLGRAFCRNCYNEWTVFTKEGLHSNITMECPKCGEEQGGLI